MSAFSTSSTSLPQEGENHSDLVGLYDMYVADSVVVSGNGSMDTLDSNLDTPAIMKSQHHNNNNNNGSNASSHPHSTATLYRQGLFHKEEILRLPKMQIHSHESSNLTPDRIHSAPVTPQSVSSSSFDFNPHVNPTAQTNPELNLTLEGDRTISDELKDHKRQLQDSATSRFSAAAAAAAGGARRGTALNQVTNEEDEAIDMEDNVPSREGTKEDWVERGAAVRTLDDDIVIKRTVQDFVFGKELGEGSYSTVVLATDKHTSKQYAVKILDKRHIIKEKKVKYVNIEKYALNRLSNRVGIISLFFTFQDKHSLYFVLDYAANGELLSLIKKYGTLNEDCTQFFGAQILDAINYMHENGVIHRDIKPENILLDDKMRIQITDFGTARMLEKGGEAENYPVDVRAKSFVGTAEYVSPELLDNKYCGKPGDIWAFGCIVYQMIAGKPPFKATNEYLTFQKITKLQYAFSAGFPIIIRDLIKKILVLQPSKRLSIQQIESHYFFHDIDFDDFDSVWNRPPPELGPYKMTAKSMMKVPDLMKSLSQPQLSTRKSCQPKKIERNVSESASSNSHLPTSSASNGTGVPVSAASVAAFVLKKESGKTSSNEELGDFHGEQPNTSSKSQTPTGTGTVSTSGQSTPHPDYIPGTKILRPTAISRQSYTSRTGSTRTSKKGSSSSITSSKQSVSRKSLVIEIAPMSVLDNAWKDYLKHEDERILKVGPVIVSKQYTDVFERKHKGSLHICSLALAPRGGSTVGGINGNTMISQVVHGSSSLRGSGLTTTSQPQPVSATTMASLDDELEYFRDYFEVEKPVPVSPTSPKNSQTSNTDDGGSTKSHRSLFKKLLNIDKEKEKEKQNEDASTTSSCSTVKVVVANLYDRPKTCTMIITTHGRIMLLYRLESGVYHKLSEIQLSPEFIQVKELLNSGAASKFHKLLPTTGTFSISGPVSSYIFEVEKYEVNQWTSALVKAKTNQIERNKEEAVAKKEEDPDQLILVPVAPATTPTLDPRKQEKSDHTHKSNHGIPKQQQDAHHHNLQNNNNSHHVKNQSQSHRRHQHSNSEGHDGRHSMMADRISHHKNTKRKPPPPINQRQQQVNMSTGLGITSNSNDINGTLHAAQLAVSHITPTTDNRRSSFTKTSGGGNGHSSPPIGTSLSNTPNGKPGVTVMNSKFLARSQRKSK